MTSENKTALPSARKCAAIWCDRVMHWPRFTFVRDAEEWEIHMRRMEVDMPYPGTAGRMNCFERNDELPICLVTLRPDWQTLPKDAIVGVLLHEAVHVYQVLRDDMGEEKPGIEFEAYTIQTMFLSLLYVIEQKTRWTL